MSEVARDDHGRFAGGNAPSKEDADKITEKAMGASRKAESAMLKGGMKPDAALEKKAADAHTDASQAHAALSKQQSGAEKANSIKLSNSHAKTADGHSANISGGSGGKFPNKYPGHLAGMTIPGVNRDASGKLKNWAKSRK